MPAQQGECRQRARLQIGTPIADTSRKETPSPKVRRCTDRSDESEKGRTHQATHKVTRAHRDEKEAFVFQHAARERSDVVIDGCTARRHFFVLCENEPLQDTRWPAHVVGALPKKKRAGNVTQMVRYAVRIRSIHMAGTHSNRLRSNAMVA